MILPNVSFPSCLIKRREPGDFHKSLTQTVQMILEEYLEYWVLLHVRCYRVFALVVHEEQIGMPFLPTSYFPVLF